MSVEHSPSAGAARTAASGMAGHGRARGQGTPVEAGGFAALLLGLGADEMPQGEALTSALDGTLAAPGEAALTDAGPAGLPLAAEAIPADLLLAQALQQAPAQLLPAAGGDGAMDGFPASALAAGDVPLPLAARAEAAAVQAAPGTGAQAPRAEAPGLAASPLATEAGLALPAAELPQAGRGAAQQRAQHKSQAAELVTQAVQALQAQRAELPPAGLAAAGDERTIQGAALAQLLQSAGLGEAGARPGERRAEKQVFRPIGSAEGGAWSGPAGFDAGRLDLPATALVPGLSPEARVAEQVSYWIGRGVQNAEMEVEGLGEGPVQVSIELQGQEARVEFRADQVQTRQVLEGATAHLRELLEREGLVLSGVTVGSSGGQGEGGRESRPSRPGGRQAAVAVPELPAAVATAGRGSPLAGRSVDLFV